MQSRRGSARVSRRETFVRAQMLPRYEGWSASPKSGLPRPWALVFTRYGTGSRGAASQKVRRLRYCESPLAIHR